MNILIIHTHENPLSVSSSLKDAAKSFFEAHQYPVVISDLYSKNFNPDTSNLDFTGSSSDYYNRLNAQLHASRTNSFSTEIKAEMDLLLKSDFVIFNFPFWRYSVPSILKGWFDHVLAHGFAYGGEYGSYGTARFVGKKVLLTITLDEKEEAFVKGAGRQSLEELLFPITHDTLEYCGFTVLPPFLVYRTSCLDSSEKDHIFKEYKFYLRSIYQIASEPSIRVNF